MDNNTATSTINEDETARQCISLDTATWDVELYVANADDISQDALNSAATILERSCAILLSSTSPDPRLARRVSRLADLFLRTTQDCAFRALCSYGALAPPHHATQLVDLFLSRGDAIHLALPAILAMPSNCLALVPLVLRCILISSRQGDADTASLAATALSELVDAGAQLTLEQVGAAGVAARDAGLDEARLELASVMRKLRAKR